MWGGGNGEGGAAMGKGGGKAKVESLPEAAEHIRRR